MSNEIKPTQSADITIASQPSPPMTFNQSGKNGTQIGHADMVKNEFNINVVDSTAIMPNGTVRRKTTQLSKEYYSLFVVGYDIAFESAEGSFLVTSDRVLEQGYTEQAIRDRFAYLTEDDREAIKSYPALFMSENKQYGKADPEQVAYWGRVTDVSPHGKDTKIKYRIIKEIPQQRLNELLTELCLHGANCFNELNRTHWAIKRVNLIEELQDAQIDIY